MALQSFADRLRHFIYHWTAFSFSFQAL